MRRLSLKNFGVYLRQCYSMKTSSRPQNWAEINPSYGHCAVVALAVHDYFGATICNGKIPPEIAHRHHTGFLDHCWNMLDGKCVDYTSEQFGPKFPYDDLVAGRLDAVRKVSKEELLRDELLAKNYAHFTCRLNAVLTQRHKQQAPG